MPESVGYNRIKMVLIDIYHTKCDMCGNVETRNDRKRYCIGCLHKYPVLKSIYNNKKKKPVYIDDGVEG